MTPPRIAILVHPTRDVRRAIARLRDWADERGGEVVQLDGPPGATRHAPAGTADRASLIVAVGGDGTVLAALRAAAPRTLPVLGVACGSLGALTTVAEPDLPMALEHFEAGDWTAHHVPALAIEPDQAPPLTAINDFVAVRAGASQVIAAIEIDGSLYGRYSGDGVVVSTQLGSSAYSMAAGGPVLVPGSDAWLVTPLAPHGGCIPPVVVGAAAQVRLMVEPGHAGARAEVDGQPTQMKAGGFGVSLRHDFATLVRVAGEDEEYLAGLRRRRIVMDSPRVLARDARSTAESAAAATAAAPPGRAPGSDSRRRSG